jgi:hydroxypyruvate reductase
MSGWLEALPGGSIRVGPDNYRARRLFVIGAGKAAAAMAQAAEAALGDRVADGVAASPSGHTLGLTRIREIVAGHPLPDQGSLRAGHAALNLVEGAHERDLVLVLISGGASALLEVPALGLTMPDLIEANAELLASGLPIAEVNRARASLSRVKAGGLASAARCQVVCLVLSDVEGDDLSTVGSGPCWPAVGPARPVQHHLIGNAATLRDAAALAAADLGLRHLALPGYLKGDARTAGTALGVLAREFARQDELDCLLTVGETTVTVRGSGLGGRCQQLALSAALELQGAAPVALLAGGSDGRDGPTDATGAVVGPDTAEAVRRAGIDPQAALDQSDSNPALAAANALLPRAITHTNLNDLLVIVRG